MPSPNATSETDGRKKEREQLGHSSQPPARPWFTPHAMHARLECYPYARYALISSSQTPPNSYRAVVLCLASKQHRVVPNHALLAELVRPTPGLTPPIPRPRAIRRTARRGCAMGDETGGWQVVGGFGGLRTQLASVPVAELRACLRIGDHDLSESDGFGASRITLLRRGCQVLTGKLWNDECTDGDGHTGRQPSLTSQSTKERVWFVYLSYHPLSISLPR
ncbi:hypothetical protein AUP68_11480 [Ilyonectria robusta]